MQDTNAETAGLSAVPMRTAALALLLLLGSAQIAHSADDASSADAPAHAHQPTADTAPSTPSAKAPESAEEALVGEETPAPSDMDVVTVTARNPDRTVEEWLDVRAQKPPVGDGADLLGDLPGFALIRQGGAGNEPVLRGLGGSRLNIRIDGVPYAGACNHAMDPATAYVNPGELSELRVLRGPQSVRYAGTISGAVDFERAPVRFDEPGATIFASGLVGSFGQNEAAGDVALGLSQGYLRASGGYAESDDYLDGKGRPVFSRYDRWNGRLALGWTPGDNTLLEASAELSDGKMANSTIHMDATKLDRRTFGLHFEKRWTDFWLEELELKFNRIEVDHEMDDFSLRPTKDPADYFPATAVPLDFLVMGQGWEEYSGRAALVLEPHESLELELGIDVRSSAYDARAAAGSKLFLRTPPDEEYTLVFDDPPLISDEPWNKIVEFLNLGAYGELRHTLFAGAQAVAGLRYDRLWTETGTMHAAGETTDIVLSGSDKERHQDLWSAFLRYEHRFSRFPIQTAVGIGHAQRGHDYWEVYSYDGFSLDPERNTEIDAVADYAGEKLDASVSFFLSQIDDFIMTYNGVAAFNVKARRVGAEAFVSYRIIPELSASVEVAFVHAKNVTDDVPLAQTPPVEGTVRLRYQSETFSIGADTRLVARQDRIHPDFGNRLGVDTAVTPGFVTLSIDASVKPWPFMDLSFGIDNLLDDTYSEHLSRLGSPPPGFTSSGKVNEPGRRFWLKLSFDLGT